MPPTDIREKIGEARWLRLESRLHELNRHIATRGVSLYRKAEVLTGYSQGTLFDWDLYFENIYLSYYGVARYCRTNLEAFLDRQLPCGFVPRSLVRERWRQHFKPFLAQIALLGSRQTGRYDWLEGRYYDRLRKYLDHWFRHWDFDRNGLCAWDSADHTGMDNQYSRAGEVGSLTTEGVDLNCYLVRELLAMEKLAAQFGYADDVTQFREHAQQLSELINGTFWDEDDGFYYDRNERTGDRARVKSVAGFMPLWAGIVPRDRARRLVNEHLMNPDEFWLKYPVPSYAKTEADYYQLRRGDECNWCGPTWIPTNYMVFHGLMKQGFRETAKDLAYRTFDLVLGEETTREYYNAETGVGQGQNPFWGWSSLGYFMPFEYELDYDPTAIENGELRPIATEIPAMSFPAVPRPWKQDLCAFAL